MQRTRNILLVQWVAALMACLFMVAIFETDTIVLDVTVSTQTEFVITTFAEIITICVVPAALFLFHIHAICDALTGDESIAPKRLLLWGTVRMMMLCVPMVVNVILYYLFGMKPSFAYMAIILLLSTFFIFPTMERCLSECNNVKE
jgi:hypothetical protein